MTSVRHATGNALWIRIIASSLLLALALLACLCAIGTARVETAAEAVTCAATAGLDTLLDGGFSLNATVFMGLRNLTDALEEAASTFAPLEAAAMERPMLPAGSTVELQMATDAWISLENATRAEVKPFVLAKDWAKLLPEIQAETERFAKLPTRLAALYNSAMDASKALKPRVAELTDHCLTDTNAIFQVMER